MIVWGVDVDTKAAHIASYDTEDDTVETWSVPWGGDAKQPVRRLCLCRNAIEADVLHHNPTPSTVAIERPTGRFPSPSLMMHAGVVAEAMAHALGFAPWFVPVSTWRKEIGLKGNATKVDVVGWARGRGWRGESIDQAEAFGVAVAASLLWVPA